MSCRCDGWRIARASFENLHAAVGPPHGTPGAVESNPAPSSEMLLVDGGGERDAEGGAPTVWHGRRRRRARRPTAAAARAAPRHGTLEAMRKLQSQGVHHITIVGADRQTSIDFWEGVLGMPFVFEQPNLDNANESHLYFDPGDGRLITIFTNEERTPDATRTATDQGCVHHIAFAVSQATFA